MGIPLIEAVGLCFAGRRQREYLCPDRGQVQVRVINQSDKAVRRLQMSVDYLDAAGKKVSNWSPFTYPGRQGPPREAPDILVQEKATAPVEHPPFMPKKTQRVAFTLQSVHFADATEWRAPGVPKE